MKNSPDNGRALAFESLETRQLLAADLGSFHNVDDPEDVNADGRVNVADAYIAIDEVRGRRAGELAKLADVDADGRVSVKDALHVIDRIRTGNSTLPLERRIERLANAIENGTLPQQVNLQNAQRLLERLETRFSEQNIDPLNVAERLARRFNEIDANGDGRLSPTEVAGEGEGVSEVLQNAASEEGGVTVDDFINAIEEHFEALGERLENPTDAFVVFDLIDENDDGVLTEDELPTSEVWNALAPADTNEDSSLTEEELVDYGRALLDEQISKLFDLLDASGDGVIRRDDVAPIAWFFLGRADEDGNESISEDEFRRIPAIVIDRLREQD